MDLGKGDDLERSKEQDSHGRHVDGSQKDAIQVRQLGMWQLWRSLPRSCKLFLTVCVVQAFTSGAFATDQLARVGDRLQDQLLILLSAIYFLLLVLDAFWEENGYQLLVCMASGGLNLVQLIVYATSLSTTKDDTAVAVVVVCAVLQAAAVALARWAYFGFGWRMYSKVACDMRLPDADRRRAVGLRLDRFSALAKLDAQLLCLLLVVGAVNGANPGGELLPPLLAVSGVCVAVAAAWLAACWTAMAQGRRRLGMWAEFAYPLCYIAAAAFMFSAVYYDGRLAQIHGEVYLMVYPVLFVMGRTAVWWDARLLASEGDSLRLLRREEAAQAAQHPADMPLELLPLVHGAWLLKLPSAGARGSSPTKRALSSAAAGGSQGRWRFFQLSHDGSTLRWDWRKYVLLLHVENVACCEADLTVTLSLTLEPDLRLKFPNRAAYGAWAHGLRLLVRLLGNPDGLGGRASTTSGGSRASSADSWALMGLAGPDPGSPNRLLQRLTSASGRPSAAGLLTKESLEAAAKRARRALGSPRAPDDGDVKIMGKLGPPAPPQVIELQADAVAPCQRPGSAGSMRQRTPTRRQDREHAELSTVGGPPPPKSRRGKHTAAAAAAGTGLAWLRRALTAPVSAFAVGGIGRTTVADMSPTKQPLRPDDSMAADLEAPRDDSPPSYLAFQLQQQLAPAAPALLPAAALPSWPRHYRSSSLGNNPLESSMPTVPEAGPAVQREATLSRWGTGGSGTYNAMLPSPPIAMQGASALSRLGSSGGGPLQAPAQAAAFAAGPTRRGSAEHQLPPFVRGKSGSPASAGGSPLPPHYPPPARGARGGSPLKPGGSLLRHGSAPLHQLQRAGSALGTHSPADSDGRAAAAPRQLFPPSQPPQQQQLLQGLGSGGWGVATQSGTPGGGMLVRHDSLGGQWAPGSKVWQAMFDAGMVAGNHHHQQQQQSGSAGSPSPTATPCSVRSGARSMAVAVELIDYEELKFGRLLGRGAEGPVYAAWYQDTPVAVKRTACNAEVDMHLAAGFHDNVVNLRGVAQHAQHAYLVMELCPRGTLEVLIHKGASSSRLDPLKLLPIVRSVARGMLHLHTRSPPLLHRDLKPGNVFIGHGNLMKVGDFGMARYAADTRSGAFQNQHQLSLAHHFPQLRQAPGSSGGRFAAPPAGALKRTLTPGVIGTAAYSAPELLHPASPREGDTVVAERLLKADVYSFGVLLWELLERRRPHTDLDGFQVQTQWVLDPESMRLPLPAIPEGLPPPARAVMEALVGLVASCTAWDPDQRPSFKEVLGVLRAAAAGEGDGAAADQQRPPLAKPL